MITKIENENEEAFKVRDLPWICEKNVNTASNLQMKVMQLKTLLLKNEDEHKMENDRIRNVTMGRKWENRSM